MKKMIKKAVVAALVLSAITSAHAGSVAGTGGGTEVTQILNNLELVQQNAQLYQQVQQTIQQVTMAQQQLKNLIAAPQQVWGDIQNQLSQVTQLVQQGQALGYSLTNIDQKFAQQFPGYQPSGAGYVDQSKAWTQTALDSYKAALNVAGVQSNNFASENLAMDQIQNLSATAPGSLQIAQAGVMVAGQEVQQLQKLRQLTMAQMQAQNAYYAGQEQRATQIRASGDEHFKTYVPTPATFKSNGLLR